ncbi:MAG: MSCRAMM family adhesin SdrC [Anaerolineae bacterium]|nr:MSCRAMM family adhesin SdrC [Anaerolineae bacterium]
MWATETPTNTPTATATVTKTPTNTPTKTPSPAPNNEAPPPPPSVDPSASQGEVSIGTNGAPLTEDINGNGISEPNEPILPTINVKLFDTYVPNSDVGNLINPDLKIINGKLQLGNLQAGSYALAITPPAGFSISTDDDDFSGLKPAPNGDILVRFTITAQDKSNLSLSFWRESRIAGQIQVDLSNNKQQIQRLTGSQQLAPAANLTINLLRHGKIVTSTVTDANGNYSFAGLRPSEYELQIVHDTSLTLVLDRNAHTPSNSALSNSGSLRLATTSGERATGLNLRLVNAKTGWQHRQIWLPVVVTLRQ